MKDREAEKLRSREIEKAEKAEEQIDPSALPAFSETVTVQFLPSGAAVEVAIGSLIHEAAAAAGATDLHMPCGAKGTCGKCLVEVVSGETESTGHTSFDKALAGKHLVMACQTRVMSNLVVRVLRKHDAAMQVVGDSQMLISEEFIPEGNEISPLARLVQVTVPPASIEEHYSDWRRLVRELGADTNPTTSIEVLRNLAECVRADNGRVTVEIQAAVSTSGYKVAGIRPGHAEASLYGVAIDIGTTTIACQLVRLSDGAIIASRTTYNAQISRGADVISRIDFARNADRQAELRSLVLGSVNQIIGECCAEAGLGAGQVRAAFVAGNTTMIHLLLGLEPKYIRESPYVPTANPVPALSADEVGLAIWPQGVVCFAPGVGSYVGGDITSGLICTDIPTDHENIYLFMDIGTNGEIVLGNADWMVGCACSAGPAFEGSGIKCGMRATDGAIEYVDISDDLKDVRCDIIGGGKASGICGSGLICLLGEMLVKGVVDQSGRFNTDLDTDWFTKIDGTWAFVVEKGENTADGSEIVITEADIENLMRTKAAIYAACALILKNVGLDWSAVGKVIIAGGFGRYIQVKDAITIGLLPDLPFDKFTYIGNSSLTGAYISLLSKPARESLDLLAGSMTYVDLSSEPAYMDSYLAAMFLPHTNLQEFPTVAEALGKANC